MKIILLLALISCSHRPPLADKKDDLVHISTVMEQVQFSYLRGCVEAYKELNLGPAFETCKVKAKDHRLEIQSIINQEPR